MTYANRITKRGAARRGRWTRVAGRSPIRRRSSDVSRRFQRENLPARPVANGARRERGNTVRSSRAKTVRSVGNLRRSIFRGKFESESDGSLADILAKELLPNNGKRFSVGALIFHAVAQPPPNLSNRTSTFVARNDRWKSEYSVVPA